MIIQWCCAYISLVAVRFLSCFVLCWFGKNMLMDVMCVFSVLCVTFNVLFGTGLLS